MLDGHPVDINRELVNPIGHDHERVRCEVTIGDDMGFVWNKQTQCYELVTDRQTWNHSIPIERFIEKITEMNGGRAFFTNRDNLGDYLLVDFVEHRRRLITSR